MELCLHGSQINLATRYKPHTPAVNYPVFVQRPGSANTSSSKYSSTLKSTAYNSINRRPVSADSKFFRNKRLKSSPREPCSCISGDQSCTNNNQKVIKRPLSSSNIYKLLLAEPIKRSWMEKDLVNHKDSKKCCNKMKSIHKVQNGVDGTTDGSSIDEEIQEEISSNDDDLGHNDDYKDLFKKNWSKTTLNKETKTESILSKEIMQSNPSAIFNKEKSKPNQSVHPKLSSSLRLTKDSKTSSATANPSKYVTFKNDDFNIINEPSASSAKEPSYDLNVKPVNQVKADLPGRVSFSKNNIFEIEYSDIDNDTDTSRSLEQIEHFRKKNVRFEDDFFKKLHKTEKELPIIQNELNNERSNNFNVKNSSTSTSDNITKDDPTNEKQDPELKDKYCCSLKCNALCKTSKPSRLNTLIENEEYNAVQPVDKSEQIIEDYKREIENINRRHELELKWSGNTAAAPSSPLTDYLSNNKKENETTYGAVSLAEDSRSNEPDKFSQIEPRNSLTDNNSVKSKSNNSNESEDTPTRDSTSTVINNYLTVTNQKTISTNTSTKPKKVKKPVIMNNGTNGRKIKSAQASSTRTTTSNNKISKAKSIGCLQAIDAKLNEFQIDKVESWMSTHEDTFSDIGNSYRKGKFGSLSNLESTKAWRETPTSKTDDEGNFSLDDQLDCNSVDGSTYDETSSILKNLNNSTIASNFDNDALKKDKFSNNVALYRDKKQDICSSSENIESEILERREADKIKEILQYLDEVDFNCDRTITNAQMQKLPDFHSFSDIEVNIDTDITADIPKVNDLVSIPNQQLARQIVSLSLRASELTKAIQLSKEHMEKLKNERLKAIRMEKLSGQTRLREQKNHYENIVTRHQGFIEQLLKDKASLCEKVSALTRRIESQTQSSEHKLQAEIARAKETVLAGEKIRRERWVRENTKKIKELTIKGLEQEINKMTSNHQKEITEVKRQHQQDILDAVDEARQKSDALEKTIRESYVQDREVAIEKERNAIRERFERQMEDDQKSFEEQRSRLISDFAMEKERLLNELRQKDLDTEVLKEKLVQDKKDIIEHLNREFTEKIRMIDKRNQAEIASIREQYESDFAIWKREQETIFKFREVENTNTIRQQCRLDRDKQIDSIVAKVDVETLKIQQDHETKISRLKSQYENELREMERAERQSRDKYHDCRSKLAESEANIQNLHATIKQLEIQLSHIQKMCDDFIKEKEGFKESARKEMQQEMDILRKERDIEIQQLHKRVQHAIEKKDVSVDVLQKENNLLKERCLKLETIIRQQRKDYCTK